MEKEDKTLVKCLMFTASLVFAVLTFCMLISISIDYNEMATNGNLLNGANLKPLLIMFYIVGVLTLATVVTSYVLTFVNSEKSEIWKNRLILYSIVLITLTVAIYAIMQFSSYIRLSEVEKALENYSVEPFARKYYTSKMALVMMFATISLLINMSILKVKNALTTTTQKETPVEPKPAEDNSEEAVLSREIEAIKSKIRLQNLMDEKSKLEGELHSIEPASQGEQISIDNLPTIEPVIEPANDTTNAEQTNDNPTEQN